MNSGINDAAQILKSSSQRSSSQPNTASALLRMLRIHNVSVEQQKPALRAWLIDNPPNPALRISLRSNGYGPLIDDLFGCPRLRRTG
jgi:hypothetical protein